MEATSWFTDEEIVSLRNDTEGCSNVIHLNNAGAGLMPNPVTESMIEHIKFEARIGGYEAAAMRSSLIHDFYIQAAKLFNCKPTNIAFGSSATDTYTRALSSIPFQPGDVILTDCDDFVSNQIQFLSLRKRLGVRIERIKNAAEGGVDLNDLEQKLHQLKPKLFALTHIPTNSGLTQPALQVAKIYKDYSKKYPDTTWYILDCCQSVGQMKLDVQELHCDFLSVTGRKFLRGPRGTGFLYVSDRVLEAGLEPMFIDMRGAEWIDKDDYKHVVDARRFEDWEFAYSTVIGTKHAIEYYLNIGEDRISKQIRSLADFIRRELAQIPKVRVLDKGPELCGLVTFHVQGSNPKFIVDELLKRKINVVPSYRAFAIIDFDEKGVEWAVRASPHYYNTREEVETFIDAIKEIV
ncbi:MAG: aminotransferase class V-fold PLP-dependent enzyme [Chryseolinea sp.]